MTKEKEKSLAILQLGFRPFFICAGSYAIISIFVWLLVYSNVWQLPLASHYSIVYWHAHEMIFGYTMAVVAGFLLTAVRTWTNIDTIQGTKLLILVMLWVLARVTFISGYIMLTAIFDTIFNLGLLVSVVIPLYKSKQWFQISAICTKLLLLLVANTIFFLGVFRVIPSGEHFGIYLGLYLILALILTIGQRVIPFFTQRGVNYPVKLRNFKVLNIANILLFLLFITADLYQAQSKLTACFALAIAIVNIVRVSGWYTYGIWRQPLLWVLYCAYGWIIVGFILKFFSSWGYIPNTVAIHAFTYGGISMITLGMMARVSLGHTGRDVYQPPKVLFFIFIILFLGACIRVFVPLVLPNYYLRGIVLSQTFWLISFTSFAIVYFPMLFTARIDGAPG